MDLNEALSSIIMNTLDDVDAGEISEIIKVLKTAGVKKLSHIKYVQESDLSEHLNKIQARMLIESFKNAVNDGDANVIQTYTVIAEAAPLIVPVLPVLDSSKPIADPEDIVKISWHLLAKSAVQNLEKGQSIRPTEFRSMIRIIVDDILKINTNPSKKFVAKVAERCIVKYPVLKDNFNCTTLGSGYDNLAYRLYTRLENLKRKPNMFSQHDVDSPPQKTRRVQIDSYGCVAWSISLPEGVSEEELLSKKEILHTLNLNSEMDHAIEILKETYYLQRTNINNNSRIKDLLKDWPVLFTERGIEAHFKVLTDIHLYSNLENSMNSKGRNLLPFFRSCNQKEVKAFMAETEIEIKNPNELLLTVLGLGKVFKENSDTVFFVDEVFNPHDLTSLPKHPCIVGKGTSILRCDEFMLTIDGVAVNTSIKDPAVAVACWFAAYYIFNFVYPVEFSCTLEFFQRCLVGINPVSGSKTERKQGKKMYQGVHPKILNLLKTLGQFDNWVNDCRNK